MSSDAGGSSEETLLTDAGQRIYDALTVPGERKDERRRLYGKVVADVVKVYAAAVIVWPISLLVVGWYDPVFVSAGLLFSGSLFLALDSLISRPEFHNPPERVELSLSLIGFLYIAAGSCFQITSKVRPGAVLLPGEREALLQFSSITPLVLDGLLLFAEALATVISPLLIISLVVFLFSKRANDIDDSDTRT